VVKQEPAKGDNTFKSTVSFRRPAASEGCKRFECGILRDAELKDKRFTRIDDAINFNWDKDFPVGELKDGKFSVRWVGK